jgi:peptidoglycan hydrolase CwlO-like protein
VSGLARAALAVALGVALVGLPPRAAAQSAEARVRAQREELDQIRRERAELERRMANLQGSVHDLREEVFNLDRQREATEKVIETLDRQIASITRDVDETNARMQGAEEELSRRRTTLQRRLVDIYKRGPLYSTEALLTARSFGELVARYKYMHELARHDRALVARVQVLGDQGGRQPRDQKMLKVAEEV